MELNEYQKLTDQFAVYPKEKELEYLVLGVISEVAELEVKIENFESIDLELGDCFWYISQLCNYFSILLSDYTDTSNTNSLDNFDNHALAGRLASIVKKYIRQDFDRERLLGKIKPVIFSLAWSISELIDSQTELENLLQKNIDKLNDRKQRNVIKGEGDDR